MKKHYAVPGRGYPVYTEDTEHSVAEKTNVYA